MTADAPRIAFFPDGFHEVDGVATVARHFLGFARGRAIPFLMVHAGPTAGIHRDGLIALMELPRSPMKFPLDRSHDFDLLFLRYYRRVAALVKEFRPDFVQITGPSDVGILGALVAHKLNVPLAAFWQTNLPQYASSRVSQALSFLPDAVAGSVARIARQSSSMATARFYRIPNLVFAPIPEIIEELADATGKPCFPMGHGVDTESCHPKFRDRPAGGPFIIGYVGRLTAEKNVRWLVDLENFLYARGRRDFVIMVVGGGAEEPWLRRNLRSAKFSGILRGEELSRAYANMDLLAFPSETETFGLVVLEAFSSGVPTVVTASGGPKYTVRHGETGYVARDFPAFAASVEILMTEPSTLLRMRENCRRYAETNSWQHAFQGIYTVYENHLGARCASTPCAPQMAAI